MRTQKVTRGPHYNADAKTAVPELTKKSFCIFISFERQARNQLGAPRGAKSFLRGAQIFCTVSNRFELCPRHFSRWGEKFLAGASPILRPPGYGPGESYHELQTNPF